MLFLALVTLPESPPEVMYLKPPTINIITAMMPTANERMFMVVVTMPLTVPAPLVVPWGQVVPDPPMFEVSRLAPQLKLLYTGLPVVAADAIAGKAIEPTTKIAPVNKAVTEA